MQAKLLRAFWISSAIILTFTGITKVISAIVPVPILNETDPVLSAIDDPAIRRTLLAARVPAAVPTYRFDIILQGDGETAFFEV